MPAGVTEEAASDIEPISLGRQILDITLTRVLPISGHRVAKDFFSVHRLDLVVAASVVIGIPPVQVQVGLLEDEVVIVFNLLPPERVDVFIELRSQLFQTRQ